MNEEKYWVAPRVIVIDELACFLWLYETSGNCYSPNGKHIYWSEGWGDESLPAQIREMYRAKAIKILQWITEQNREETK